MYLNLFFRDLYIFKTNSIHLRSKGILLVSCFVHSVNEEQETIFELNDIYFYTKKNRFYFLENDVGGSQLSHERTIKYIYYIGKVFK